MAAANTDLLRKTKANFSTTLDGGITDSDATIACSSLSGVATDTAVMFTIDRVDSNGTATPSSMEGVIGVVSGNNITTATRGVEGSAQAHSSGAVVEILWTADNVNDLVDWALAEHNQDGTHGAVTASSAAVSGIISAIGDSGTLNVNADADGGDFNIYHGETGTKTLALYGSAGNILDLKLLDGKLLTDTIAESTSAAGVTIDGVKLKDGGVTEVINYQNITTNTTQTVITQAGWNYILGDGTSAVAKAITFPVAFSAAPTVVTTCVGYKSTTPSSIGDTTSSNFGEKVTVKQTTATGFSGILTGAAALSANYFLFSWIAIGPA